MSYDVKHMMEGIARKKVGNEFVYYYIDTGKTVTEKDLNRIRKLKIPPAWNNVWISRDPFSPIQAIGIDSKGRKQYRYHQVHIERAEVEKFLRMYSFIKLIPKLEKIMNQHRNLPIYEKNRVISLMLQLVRDYHMRVGKEIYARKYHSYGISSLRKRHVKIDKNVIFLKFKGKSGQRLHYTIREPYYINSIKMLMKLEGEHLFQYITLDDRGNEINKRITDRDLNAYIQKYLGKQFTIKDFRTFGANFYFVKNLLNETRKRTPRDRKIIKKNILRAIRSTATKLKHTGAVSKKSYILNFSIELYQNSPDFFVKHKNDEPTKFLLTLLRLYKKNILNK